MTLTKFKALRIKLRYAYCLAIFAYLIYAIFPIRFYRVAQTAIDALELDECKYEIIHKSDNLERGSSCWDDYEFDIKYSEPFDKTFLAKFSEKNGWEKQDNGSFYKSIEIEDGLTYSAFVNLEERTAKVGILIDELFELLKVFLHLLNILVITASFVSFWLIRKLIKIFTRKR